MHSLSDVLLTHLITLFPFISLWSLWSCLLSHFCTFYQKQTVTYFPGLVQWNNLYLLLVLPTRSPEFVSYYLVFFLFTCNLAQLLVRSDTHPSSQPPIKNVANQFYHSITDNR